MQRPGDKNIPFVFEEQQGGGVGGQCGRKTIRGENYMRLEVMKDKCT